MQFDQLWITLIGGVAARALAARLTGGLEIVGFLHSTESMP